MDLIVTATKRRKPIITVKTGAKTFNGGAVAVRNCY